MAEARVRLSLLRRARALRCRWLPNLFRAAGISCLTCVRAAVGS